MAKEIQYDVEARSALKNGVDKLANAVKVTLNQQDFSDKTNLEEDSKNVDSESEFDGFEEQESQLWIPKTTKKNNC